MRKRYLKVFIAGPLAREWTPAKGFSLESIIRSHFHKKAELSADGTFNGNSELIRYRVVRPAQPDLNAYHVLGYIDVMRVDLEEREK